MNTLNNLKWIEQGVGNVPIVVSETEPAGEFGKKIGIWCRPLPKSILGGTKYPMYALYVYTGGNRLARMTDNLYIPRKGSFLLIFLLSSTYSDSTQMEKEFSLICKATKWAFIGILDPSNSIELFTRGNLNLDSSKKEILV